MPASNEFALRYGPAALVIGGSEGIGRAFAASLAGRGLDLVLVARRAAPLAQAADELRTAYGIAVTTYARDITAPGIERFAAELCAAHDIGLVVCNAGATHGVGWFLDQPLDKALQLVRLNCLAPVTLAHVALARRRGRAGGLIMVSSMSGLCGSGLVATYAAAKAFEITLCEGLHWELAREGLDVLCAVAGLTDTPAMRASGLSFEAAAAGGFTAMEPAAVADGALAHLGRVPVWYAVGEGPVTAMRALPRAQLTQSMSAASAALYGARI